MSSQAISRVLEAARKKLLDTGTRNRLIHVNRANTRANCLNIINERADEVHGILRVQSRKMRFKALGKDKAGEDQEMLLALPEAEIPAGADRLTDQFLETPLGPEALARRLLRLASDAKTAEEEQGLNILYLSLGFLQWRENASSEMVREAPLVLLPVRLVRNERTSTYDIECRDDDIATNLPLQQRLRTDFGVSFPDIEEGEEWSPSDYFSKVRDAISAQPDWSLDGDGMQLGFFSFAKLLMHRDLDVATWPEGAFEGNDILRGLLADGFEEADPIFGDNDRLDDILDPAEIVQVIDADASQTKVIEEVRRGSSLVVQGPPGTGKSQTITNLIAAAAHDGKTVLFVAEKMAALSVVHDRLVRSGLRDICLELHSRSANKKTLAQELGRTLMASSQALPGSPDPAQLRIARDRLNRISDLLHVPMHPTDDTPFRALAEIVGFIGKDAPPPCVPLGDLAELDRSTRDQATSALRLYVEALKQAGPPNEHPFRGSDELDLQPTDLTRLEAELSQAIYSLEHLLAESERLTNSTGISVPRTLFDIDEFIAMLRSLSTAPAGARDWIRSIFAVAGSARLDEALAAGNRWFEARRSADAEFSDAAWAADHNAIRSALAQGQASFWSRLFGGYRRASGVLATFLSGPLPKSPSDRLASVNRIIQVQALRKALSDEEGWLKTTLGDEWRGEATPFAQIAAAAKWIAQLRQGETIRDVEQLLRAIDTFSDPAGAADALSALCIECRSKAEAPLTRLRLNFKEAFPDTDLNTAALVDVQKRYQEMLAEPSRYNDWARLSRSIKSALNAGAEIIVKAVSEGRVSAERAADEFLYACAEARWNAARQSRPELRELPQLNRHDLVRLFGDLETERIDTARNLILSNHFQQIPRGTMGEMGVIRGEIGRKRGHKPIRWVMKNAGAMVQRIKPVMLMSPISVAQFLPPSSAKFDILVIDEASQIRPEDALGVIARARQIVVVGDQKQLPPTSFFDRLVDDVEDNDEEEDAAVGATAADMESILSLCEARGLRQRMLEWHYRSRDPSLIRVSNAEFYEDRLVLPPSPLQLDPDYGLKFRRVPGVYARGGSGIGRQGTNRIEAEAVVAAVADHARNWPELSLGVVAFSKAQSNMLTEVLELQRRRDPVLDAFLREGKSEDIFVKNIENVQGDERDVILISVGYGPQEANGRLPTMSFGPVNGEGGERRLNVLFSRSRVRCEVFASFDPGDIDPSRSTREGPRVLKRFLDFAKTGQIETHVPSGLDADSPFEEDVARIIRAQGFLADPQVGSSGFRIDIGVRHPDRPGQYLLAVECDGAAYHSALWARERDRLRQGILENLGWQFHRIWSTDWFHHRAQEIDRLAKVLERVRASSDEGIKVRGANHGLPLEPAAEVVIDAGSEAVDIGHLELSAPAYVRAAITVKSNLEPHEAPVHQLADLVSRIVAIEGPIHTEEVARRISSAFGLSRTGKRIADAAARAIKAAMARDTVLKKKGAFLMTAEQMATPPVRDRSMESGNILKAQYLSPSEIAAAAQMVLAESGDVPRDDLIRAVGRLLGFQRVGPDLHDAISAALPD